MKRRGAITGGILLILFGVVALVSNFMPEQFKLLSWPFFIISVGVIFILAAIMSKMGGLVVPGMIVAGIGGIFYYQRIASDYASWAYLWALIPAFVGLGIILSGLIDHNLRATLTGGLILIGISLALFFVFGGSFGLNEEIVRYWPTLLIAWGVIILLRQVIKKKSV